MPVLKLLKGSGKQQQYDLHSDRVVLGRDSKCEIRLEPEEVSRHHAEIIREGDQYFVVDLDSRNYSYLNGARLEPFARVPLHNNDLIKICTFIFTFSDAASDRKRLRLTRGQGNQVELVESNHASGFSSRIDSTSGSWHQRIAVNPEAKLRAMMQITRDMHNTLVLDDLLQKILESLLTIFPQAYCAVVVLYDERTKKPDKRVVRYRAGAEDESVFVSRVVIDHVIESQKAIISDDVKLDPRFSTSHSVAQSAVRSIMCAPLLNVEGHSLGVLQLDALRRHQPFNEGDLDLLSTVALQISLSVEDSKLHEESLRQREMQRDLEVAREIQLGLLPSSVPKISGYDFFDFYAPAKHVGGDYYDYLPLSEDKLGIVLGDVAGKGVSAALLMAKLSSEMRLRLTAGIPPVGIFTQVNTSFYAPYTESRFVTTVLMVLDTANHDICLVNAGHMRPLLRSNANDVTELGADEAGMPLGVVQDYQYREFRLHLEPGDPLVLFSDGISDAMNEDGQTLGIAGLQSRLGKDHSIASEFGKQFIDELHQFVGNRQQVDDICLLCISRNE